MTDLAEFIRATGSRAWLQRIGGVWTAQTLHNPASEGEIDRAIRLVRRHPHKAAVLHTLLEHHLDEASTASGSAFLVTPLLLQFCGAHSYPHGLWRAVIEYTCRYASRNPPPILGAVFTLTRRPPCSMTVRQGTLDDEGCPDAPQAQAGTPSEQLPTGRAHPAPAAQQPRAGVRPHTAVQIRYLKELFYACAPITYKRWLPLFEQIDPLVLVRAFSELADEWIGRAPWSSKVITIRGTDQKPSTDSIAEDQLIDRLSLRLGVLYKSFSHPYSRMPIEKVSHSLPYHIQKTQERAHGAFQYRAPADRFAKATLSTDLDQIVQYLFALPHAERVTAVQRLRRAQAVWLQKKRSSLHDGRSVG